LLFGGLVVITVIPIAQLFPHLPDGKKEALSGPE
jgi:hypothetical protein